LSRGNHSNNNASEILICLKGTFEIKLHDGVEEKLFRLNKNDAIYVNKNIWISYYNFDDCIIMAFVNIIVDDKTSCYSFNDFILNNKK
jgi:quercetin dioxygenase-like cupin family protein